MVSCGAGAQRGEVRLLSGTIYRRDLHNPHPATDALLRLQHYHSVCTHVRSRSGYLPSASRRRREDRSRYGFLHFLVALVNLTKRTSNSRTISTTCITATAAAAATTYY